MTLIIKKYSYLQLVLLLADFFVRKTRRIKEWFTDIFGKFQQ